MTQQTAPRLGLATQVSYGLGAVAQGVGNVALAQATINFYLVAVVGLRPVVVGTVMLISLVIDAVLDPFIGRWSDTFRSPWGRRHPFLYGSALPIALAIAFLWRQPPGLSHEALTIYVLVMLIVVRLAGGVYTIPSDALAPELAPDYHQRTGLISWRYGFGLFAAAAMGFILRVGFLRQNPYNAQAYAGFGTTAAIIVFVAIIVSSLATHRFIPFLTPAPVRRQSAGQTLREIAAILSNRSLVAVMAAGLISGVAGGITSMLQDFMTYNFWELTPAISGFIGVAALPGALLGVVAAPFLSQALGKKRSMITVFALSVFAGVVPPTLRLLGVLPPNGSPLIPPILAADLFVATALALSGFVIVGSMVADVVEDSAVKTGVRSEGLLFAANGLLPKITGGLGGLIGGLMLEFVHFPMGKPSGHVDPTIMRNLVLLSLPIGAVLNLTAIAVLGFYRINRASHEANLEALRLAATVAEPPEPALGVMPLPDIGAASNPPI